MIKQQFSMNLTMQSVLKVLVFAFVFLGIVFMTYNLVSMIVSPQVAEACCGDAGGPGDPGGPNEPPKCEDPSASNYGGNLPCTYPKCEDPAASNYQGPLPCVYPPSYSCAADVNYTVNPTSLVGSGSVNLKWSTQNVKSLSINNTGFTALSGDESVNVSASTNFNMNVTFVDNTTAVCPGSVTVTAAPSYSCATDVLKFEANPNPVAVGGGDTTITWETQNVKSLSIDNIVSTALSGSETVNVTTATDFNMNVTFVDDSTATCPLKVTVKPSTPLPLCKTFTANGVSDKLTITSAQDVTLAWTTENTSQVSINNGVGIFTGAQAQSGSKVVNVTGDIEYILTPSDGTTTGEACKVIIDLDTGGGDEFSCKDDVNFRANPNSLPNGGGQVTLTWTTTNDVQSVAMAGFPSLQNNDSVSVEVDEETTYSLDVTFTDGSKESCPVTIDVDEDGGGGGGGSSTPRCEFLASDKSISAGDVVTLSWETRRGREVTIYEGDEDDQEIFFTDDDDEVDEGEIEVRPTKDTKYTLVVARGSRDRSCEVKINVDDNIVVLEARDQQPRVAGIALTQVPYTGFEAGPVLTFIFYALLALWGAFVAYFYILKKRPEVAAANAAQVERDEFEKKVARLTDLYTGRNLL